MSTEVDFDLRIGQTGIRSGEVVTASPSATQSRGVVFEVVGFFPPDLNRVNDLSITDIRDKLNLVPFFTHLTADQRKGWLLEHSEPQKDLYIDDTDVSIKFIRIDGNNFFTKTLSQDDISSLLKGNPETPDGSWPIQQVYNMFPRKPGSKAPKHTLIFRPANWRLLITKQDIDTYTGVYIDFDDIKLKSGSVTKPQNGTLREIEIESESNTRLPKFGVYSSFIQPPLSLDDIFSLCGEYVDIGDLEKFQSTLKWFPPSLHKSLIQKLIRTRCEFIEFGGVNYPAAIPLLVSFSMLITHPGVFVPNIQRFVTGAESAIKRLAVSICEDSYTEDFEGLVSLYSGALMKQRTKTWNPPKHLISRWIVMAINSQRDHRRFLYNHRDFTDDITVLNSLSVSYLLLQEVKSFHSDIKMVGSIAQNLGSVGETNGVNSKIEVMPLVHCVDHHSFGDIAHFMPYPTIPYPELFGEIWRKVVGVNPRYLEYADYYETMEKNDFVKSVRQAQVNLWVTKMYLPQQRPYVKDTTDPQEKIVQSKFTYELDPSWLAGLIGPIEVRLRSGTAMVVLRVDNIFNMTAVKKPSRDKTVSPTLTDEEQIIAINTANELLSKGIKLTNVPSTLPLLSGATVYRREDTYIVAIDLGDGIKVYDWETLRNLNYMFPIHPTMSIESPCNNAVLHTGKGIDERSVELLQELVTRTDLKVLRRLIVYLTGNRSSVELHKVSRDGSGTYYQVLPEDTGVHHFLCALTIIYPVAMQVTKNGFVVNNGPLLWSARDYIAKFISTQTTFGDKWTPLLPEKRQRWEHQVSSLEQMKQRNSEGKRGHLIWIDVGMGKTMISLDYLDYLISHQKMPRYCVYTLPPSAIDNTIREADIKGIPYKIIDARKSAQKAGNNVLEPYVINIIRHDHMILNGMDEQLKTIANECIFIVDEFHKTLAKTKRTSIALEITRLSHDFIGMSGTIIKDTDTDELIEWLEQIVEFEVTKNNYWVAVGALVSRKVQTQVVVSRQLIDVPIDKDHRQKYYSLVPEKMGGTANSIKFNEALNLSYEVVTKVMIDMIRQYIDLGEGVFVVAKNIAHQEEIRDGLIGKGLPDNSISLFGKDNQITLTPEYDGPVKVVITTISYNAGYTLTKFRIMIQSEYPSNQATREQLEGRINRIGQISPQIRIIVLVTGILTYIHAHHENARTLSEAMRGFAKDAGVDYKTLAY